jgi:U6 snRNA-associated Sm-like protein LSm8
VVNFSRAFFNFFFFFFFFFCAFRFGSSACSIGAWLCRSCVCSFLFLLFLQGFLRGADQVINVVLEECQERIYSETGVEQVPLGLFIVRGDNVAAIGEIDEAREEKIDFSLLRGTALPPVVH